MTAIKVAKSAASLGSLQFINRVLDLLSIMVLARVLAPEDFGLVTLSTSVMLIAIAITDLPVIDALVQQPEIIEDDINSAFTLNLLRGVAILLAMIGVSYPMALIYDDMRLIGMILVLAIVPLCKSLESPALVYPLRKVNYGPIAKSLFVGKLLGTLASIILAWATESFWALIIGLVVTGIVTTLWTYYLCPYKPRLRFKGFGNILGFAWWVTLSKIIFSLNQQADRFFVGYFIGKSSLGQYTIGSEIASLATYTLASPIMRPIFGGMSRIQGDLPRLRAAYLRSQQALMMLVLPIGFGLVAVADKLVPLLLGSGWNQAVIAIWWLAPVISLQMLSVAVHPLAMSMGATSTLAYRELLALVIRLPATLIGAWYFGFLGALIARSLTGILIILINLAIARSLIAVSISDQLLNGWRSLVSATVMAGTILWLNITLPTPEPYALLVANIAALVLLGLGIYSGLHAFLWYMAGKPDSVESQIWGMLRKRLASRD